MLNMIISGKLQYMKPSDGVQSCNTWNNLTMDK